jgi:HEAT repeat protein
VLQVQGSAGPVRIGVPICFEDTVSRAVRSIVTAGEGAGALVNLTNDGWFGAYLPGRAQHEQAARWRTIEHRLPMVRVANTGVTAAFDEAGRRIGGPLAAGTEGVLRVELPVGSRGGVFTRTGDVASWAMFLGSVVMMVRARRPRLGGGAVRAASWSVLVALLGACGGAKDGRVESWSSKQQSVTEDSTVALSKGPRVRPQLPVSASADPARNARQLLDEASRSVDPMIRAIAIEAMEHDPTVLEPAVRRGLGDPNPGVRFCAAVVGSKAGLSGLAPLVEPLLLDASPSVQSGAILALHRCGRPVDPTPLAAMVVSPSPEIRGNAVMVLGDLGNRTAMPLLKQGFETPMPRAMPAAVRVVDLQIAEAMVKLGDLSQLEPIHAALFSRSDQGECIALACQIVGTLRDKSSLPMLQRLIDAGGDDTRPVEIRLVAAIACMKILSPGPEALAELGLLGSQDKRPEVRALAARLLGWFQTPQAAVALSQLLRDRDPSVQISAAASLLLQDASARGREPAQR